MEEILHHLGCIQPCQKMGETSNLNWCRMSSIRVFGMTSILLRHGILIQRRHSSYIPGIYGPQHSPDYRFAARGRLSIRIITVMV